ncbi:probable pectinesterase/pectinesterase inhibitor 51 [Phragmites australis]|uniref:probable pectinesterase/pectinesterase inhibitor 51 n=1 Tax=Phragmites australis TaxID=29695 RepID=UPI002D77B052|nr:probable pectinesterase/pectinesterase inhibitor 51 [Phragmites australis]
MPRGHHHPLPRRGRLLPLAAGAAALLLLALLILLPAAPPGGPAAAPASLLGAAVAAHPSPASYARPCTDHLALSLRRLRSALSSLESGDVAAALHLASASLQCQYDCSHLLSLPAFRSHLLTSRFLNSLAPKTLTAALKPSSASAAFLARIRPDATVCKPNPAARPCGYSTVQAAVDAAPNYTAGHFVITVAAGTYKENVIIPYEKTNILLVGEGMGATVITASRSVGIDGLGTYDTATVAVIGDGFRARDITFENSAGAGAHQAVAFRSDSDRSVLENVEFCGHQDTLYARTMRQFYRQCHIVGTVDFIFGNAAAMFEGCVIKSVPRAEGARKSARNVVAANGRIDPGQTTGFVFRNCTVDGNKDFVELFQAKPQSYRVYLGRPWKEYARTVYVSCYLGTVVRPEGWLPWRGDFALRTLYYGEFDSRGPGANRTARVEWSSQTPEQHVKFYSVDNFIQGHQWIAY